MEVTGRRTTIFFNCSCIWFVLVKKLGYNVRQSFPQITSVVNQQLDTLFPERDFPDLRVIAEPGRFYAASAFTLVTNVIAKKKVSDGEPNKQFKGEKGIITLL